VKAFLLVALGLVVAAAGQERNPVEWKLSAPAKATAGATVSAALEAAIAPGWHLYSLKEMDGGPIPTRVTVVEGQAFRLAGAIEAPPPATKQDETFGMEVESYEGSVEFRIPVRADAAGRQTLKVAVRYQVCDDKLCLPPRTVPFETVVEITK
jgi:thiol:disulfide interchange protein DsbD